MFTVCKGVQWLCQYNTAQDGRGLCDATQNECSSGRFLGGRLADSVKATGESYSYGLCDFSAKRALEK